MELVERLRVLTGQYEWYPLECDGLTRVLQTLLYREGIRCQVYGGEAVYMPTGERTPPHLWLEVETEQGRYRVDYRVRLWLQRGQDQDDIPHGVFRVHSFPNVLYHGVEVALAPLDDLHFALLTHLGTLFPLGYRRQGADTYIQDLMAVQQPMLVEARFTPFARNRPRWCRYGKQGLEQTWRERYVYYSNRTQGRDENNDNWLGNKNYNNGGPVELVNLVEGLHQLFELLTTGWNVIVLCGCAEYEECHLKTIGDGLRELMPLLPIVPQPLLPSIARAQRKIRESNQPRLF